MLYWYLGINQIREHTKQMATFKKFNGKTGFDQIRHTATGYKCLSKPVSAEDIGKEIYFFAKHVVDKNGKPYTEIGFESTEVFNKKDLIETVKIELTKFGFKEAFSINNAVAGDLSFSQQATPYPNTVEFKIHAGKDGVVMAFDALQSILSKEALAFVHDQEADLENILYESIMEAMGVDLKKGPGGEQRAVAKAKELTQYFIHGYAV
jgi:hypothetical protein